MPMDQQHVTRAIAYHGPTLVDQLYREEVADISLPSFLSLPQSGTKKEPDRDDDFDDCLTSFIAKKADLLFKAHSKFTSVSDQPVDEDAPDMYAVVPPLETYMEVPDELRRKEFYRTVEVGDIMIGVVSNILEGGLVLTLLCFDYGKARDITSLKLQATCSVREIPHHSRFENVMESFKIKDLIRGVVVSVGTQVDKICLSLHKDTLPPDKKRVLLGTVDEADLPVHYRRLMRLDGASYTEHMMRRLGFSNASSVSTLSTMLKLGSDRRFSLMRGLQRGTYPKEDYAKALRKSQSHRWAFKSVAEGVAYFKLGKYVDAMQHLNKALNMDNENVEAYVARGALYANNDNYLNALKDFSKALEYNPEHQNAKSYMYQTLLVYARSMIDEGDDEGALKHFEAAVKIKPDQEEAKNAVRRLHAKIAAARQDSVSKNDESEDERANVKSDTPDKVQLGEMTETERTSETLRRLLEEERNHKMNRKKRKDMGEAMDEEYCRERHDSSKSRRYIEEQKVQYDEGDDIDERYSSQISDKRYSARKSLGEPSDGNRKRSRSPIDVRRSLDYKSRESVHSNSPEDSQLSIHQSADKRAFSREKKRVSDQRSPNDRSFTRERSPDERSSDKRLHSDVHKPFHERRLHSDARRSPDVPSCDQRRSYNDVNSPEERSRGELSSHNDIRRSHDERKSPFDERAHHSKSSESRSSSSSSSSSSSDESSDDSSDNTSNDTSDDTSDDTSGKRSPRKRPLKIKPPDGRSSSERSTEVRSINGKDIRHEKSKEKLGLSHERNEIRNISGVESPQSFLDRQRSSSVHIRHRGQIDEQNEIQNISRVESPQAFLDGQRTQRAQSDERNHAVRERNRDGNEEVFKKGADNKPTDEYHMKLADDDVDLRSFKKNEEFEKERFFEAQEKILKSQEHSFARWKNAKLEKTDRAKDNVAASDIDLRVERGSTERDIAASDVDLRHGKRLSVERFQSEYKTDKYKQDVTLEDTDLRQLKKDDSPDKLSNTATWPKTYNLTSLFKPRALRNPDKNSDPSKISDKNSNMEEDSSVMSSALSKDSLRVQSDDLNAIKSKSRKDNPRISDKERRDDSSEDERLNLRRLKQKCLDKMDPNSSREDECSKTRRKSYYKTQSYSPKDQDLRRSKSDKPCTSSSIDALSRSKTRSDSKDRRHRQRRRSRSSSSDSSSGDIKSKGSGSRNKFERFDEGKEFGLSKEQRRTKSIKNKEKPSKGRYDQPIQKVFTTPFKSQYKIDRRQENAEKARKTLEEKLKSATKTDLSKSSPKAAPLEKSVMDNKQTMEVDDKKIDDNTSKGTESEEAVSNTANTSKPMDDKPSSSSNTPFGKWDSPTHSSSAQVPQKKRKGETLDEMENFLKDLKEKKKATMPTITPKKSRWMP